MVIRKMTATFGCLDEAVLELHAGFQEIILPNESGKSTWSAFLLAMFYGIDTTERAAKGRLPVKTRFQPWNGKPMAGIVELEHHGKIIVLQRTSTRGRPLGQFRAYEKDTGVEIPELTGETCGMYFFGVERSVFQRSAFLSGEELTVTEDGALSRRLENLAAAGTAEDSYPAAAETLRQWKNRCRYHQNGLIPDTERRLEQTVQTIELMEELRQQRLHAEESRAQCCREIRERETQAELDWQAAKQQAAEETARALAKAEQTEALVSRLPPEDQLQSLLTQLEQKRETLPAEPSCPAALHGIPAEKIPEKAQQDRQEYEALRKTEENRGSKWLLVGLAIAVLAVPTFRFAWPAAAVLLVLALICAGLWFRQRGRGKKAGTAASAILEGYGVPQADQILSGAIAWRDWLLTRDRIEKQNRETASVLEEISAFAPQASSVSEAADALKEGLRLYREAERARQDLTQTQLRQQILAQPRPTEMEEEKEKAAALRLQAETLRAREEALGGLEKLETKRQQLQQELEMLRNRETALALAQEALNNAHDRLTQVYAPRLTALASGYLQRLTGGRYDGLILQKGLQLLVREGESGITRPLISVSRGTQDQSWLALRLAMTRLLLPDDAPILLDDALTAFDQNRTNAAGELLRRENRQIIVFACR